MSEENYSLGKLEQLLRSKDGKDENISKEVTRTQDPVVLEFLRRFREVQEDVENVDRVEDSDIYKIAMTRATDENMAEAIDKGETWRAASLTGMWDSTNEDLSAYRPIEKLEEMLNRPVVQWYLYGKQGDGKTALALFTAYEVFPRVFDDLEGGTNIKDIQSTEKCEIKNGINTYSGLVEWLESIKEREKTGVFVLDEASQNLTGFGSDIKRGQAISTLLKLFRKYNCHLILIGHSGRDVTKDIRRMTTLIHKTSEKTARVGTRCDDEGVIRDDWLNHTLRGVPNTNVVYDDEETTEWHMDIANEDEDEESEREEMARMLWRLYHIDNYGSYREISETVDLPKSTVSDLVKEHQKRIENKEEELDDDLQEQVDNIEKEISELEEEVDAAVKEAESVEDLEGIDDKRKEIEVLESEKAVYAV